MVHLENTDGLLDLQAFDMKKVKTPEGLSVFPSCISAGSQRLLAAYLRLRLVCRAEIYSVIPFVAFSH